MPESGSKRRNSRALEAPLIADPVARAAAEARNGLRQYDAGIKTVQTALERGTFKLRLSLVLALHREALFGISNYAGNFRPAGVKIEGSKHEPVGVIKRSVAKAGSAVPTRLWFFLTDKFRVGSFCAKPLARQERHSSTLAL